MLKYSIIAFSFLLLVSSCKTEKERRMSKQSEKLKIVKHKNQNPTLENSDFLYNTESEEELKKQHKKNYDKRKELERYQPSRNSNNQEFERRKKTPPKSNTHY